MIEVEKNATRFFTGSPSKHMAFLISFGSEAELLQDSTGETAASGLDGLRVRASPVGILPGPVPTASQPRGTILFDAVALAATEKLQREVGRKAIVIITDGVDHGSRFTISEAIAAAHKSDAIIYSIQYIDPMYQMFGSGDGDLKKMSEETGGRLFRVGRKNSLEEIFTQIQEEMRSQYSAAYTPLNANKDGAFRKVEIKTARKDLKVQARKGYFATASASN
ncbi:MAG: VWA domain-containing protein [Bryobacteraceae bacterium]